MAITAVKDPDGTFRFSGRSLHPTKDKNEALLLYGKQVHNYGQVLLLLPTAEQAEALCQQIGNARFVRNRYLDDRIGQYQKDKTVLGVNTYKKEYLPMLKEAFPFLLLSDKFALESALECVDKAFQNFYDKRAGFPKFAAKQKPNGNRYTTKYTNGNICLLTGKDGLPYLQLPKIGKVRFVLPKGQIVDSLCPPGTRILKATVTRISTGRFEVSLGMESILDLPEKMLSVKRNDILGIDLGIKDFCVIGDGESSLPVGNPKWIKCHERRLRRLQKSLSRKQYDKKTHTGSKNWEKARIRVAKEQKKTADQRKDLHHKLSRSIADSCSVAVCEDLNIRGMLKNRHLSKAVASVGWGQFLTFLKYKMERFGGRLLKVDRWYASSQTCSVCGYKNREVKDLGVRAWTCPECGTHHDRDGNATANMVKEGIRILMEEGIMVLPAAL